MVIGFDGNFSAVVEVAKLYRGAGNGFAVLILARAP